MAENEAPITREEFRQLCARMDAAELRLNKGDTTLALIDAKLTSINEKLTELMDWKNQEQLKPAQRWDAIIAQVLGIIVAAVAGFAVSKLF